MIFIICGRCIKFPILLKNPFYITFPFYLNNFPNFKYITIITLNYFLVRYFNFNILKNNKIIFKYLFFHFQCCPIFIVNNYLSFFLRLKYFITKCFWTKFLISNSLTLSSFISYHQLQLIKYFNFYLNFSFKYPFK